MHRKGTLPIRAFLGAWMIALALFVGLIGGGGLTAPAMAQTTIEAPDYEAWNTVARRAEGAIESGRASDEAYTALREELVRWREQFLAAQDINTARIATVRNQIAALGPAPAEGSTETEDLAARRAELNASLTELLAPVQRAVEAHSRAEGLVREIDSILRDRQADALLERDPSPLNPAQWPRAWTSLTSSMRATVQETERNWSSQARRTVLRDDLPVVVGLILVALVLLFRGRRWMEALTTRAFDRFGNTLAALAVSTGQVIVPTAGVMLLVGALVSSGLLGLRGLALAQSLPTLVLAFFTARWIAGRVFPKSGGTLLEGEVSAEQSAILRNLAGALGAVTGLFAVLGALARQENYEGAINAVLFLPLHVLGGLLLFKLGRVLRGYCRDAHGAANSGVFQLSIVAFMSRAAMLIGVVAPLLAAAGYTAAAQTLVVPPAETLAVFGCLLILGVIINEAYRLLVGISVEESAAALVPTLVNFVLVVCSLPVLALIWGARWTDLTEILARFQEGFALGDTRIQPSDFLVLIIVFALGFAVTRMVQGGLKNAVLPKTQIDPGGRNAIVSGVGYLGIFLAALIAITAAGINLSALAVVAGALSVGIGFGLRAVVENFVAGIILLVERPIGEGDWIEVGSNMGIVKAISVRSTRIETFDKTEVIVPNADFISGTVTNWTRGNIAGRLIVSVGVAYGTDTRRVSQILQEIAEAQPLVVVNPPPTIIFAGFGADSLDFEMRMILRDVNFSLSVKNEVHHQIAERFAAEGIEVPFAQRDIWLRNPEALRASAPLSGGDPELDGDGSDDRAEGCQDGASSPGDDRNPAASSPSQEDRT